MADKCLAVILAAGEGTRMRSPLPKVLHKIGGLPMLAHVISALEAGGADRLAVVIGHGGEAVCAAVAQFPRLGDAPIRFFEQIQRLGTAHAVLAAEPALEEAAQTGADVLIAYGDTPLLPPQPAEKARQMLAKGADIVVSGFYADNPMGYGRLLVQNGVLKAIIEEKDATPEQKKIKLCNGGFMAVRATALLPLLRAVENKNAKGEYYLTDIIAIGAAKGLKIAVMETEAANVLGVNSQAELAAAAAVWQQRQRQAAMAAGVVLQAPETVYFSYDTEIAANVELEPHIYFGLGVKIAAGAVIRAFSHIEGAEIGAGCIIGPYARLRPGAKLAEQARIGNFCEVKQAEIGAGAKVNHLTYIGDAVVGAGSNIGAGTITCNYDGVNKQQVIIGEGAFIGSNSSLVAPLTIGEGAYVASGSVITANVSPDALAFGRARQVEKPEGAKRLKALFALKKAEKKKSVAKKPE